MNDPPNMITFQINHHTMCCRLRGSLFLCIYCTICTLIFMLILSIIIFWIIISPSNIKFHVTDASLTQFNLTTDNTLYYNLRVNITVRNPNNNILVYYRKITAIAWYKDNAFGAVELAPFDQGHKNTTFLQAVFEGQNVIRLKGKQVAEYKEETSVGIYNDLALDLDLTIKAKYGRFKRTGSFNPAIVQCRRLGVPLISKYNCKTPPPFSASRCKTGASFVDRNAGDA